MAEIVGWWTKHRRNNTAVYFVSRGGTSAVMLHIPPREHKIAPTAKDDACLKENTSAAKFAALEKKHVHTESIRPKGST